MSLASMVADAWDQTLRESPDPFTEASWGYGWFGTPKRTYRERLDRQRRNVYGDLIPRIATVRRNLALFRKPRRVPRLPT